MRRLIVPAVASSLFLASAMTALGGSAHNIEGNADRSDNFGAWRESHRLSGEKSRRAGE
jgi:hypothetical protein